MEISKSWVCYYRVSTQRQGESGLGLEAQQRAVAAFRAPRGGEVLAEFTEVESGRKNDRPKLQEALAFCRKRRATLLIAKLDRLARSVFFISGLMESGVEFLAVDQPTKDRFMLHIQAAFAEEEARRISERTKAAMLSAKLRGVVIGETGRIRARVYKHAALDKAQDYRTVIDEILTGGTSAVRGIRDELNKRRIPSPGGGQWHLPNTQRLLKRLESTVG